MNTIVHFSDGLNQNIQNRKSAFDPEFLSVVMDKEIGLKEQLQLSMQ